MEPLVQSQNLSVSLTTPLEADFVVDQIDVTEAISELYELVIHVHTKESEIAFDGLLGEMISVSITSSQADGTSGDNPRLFAGIVGRIHQRQTFVDGEGTTVAYYTFYAYPELWRTTLNQDCKIFQEQSVQDITEALLDQYNVSGATVDIQDLPEPTRTYCVQYNESVFHFLSRLWEEEGMSYFFTHTAEGASLTIINDTQSHVEPVTPDTIALQHFEKSTLVLNAIQNITYEASVIPNQFDTIDYDNESPSKSLNVVSPASEYKGGRVFEYPGVFTSLDQGEKLAQMRTEEITWDSAMIKGQSTVLNFSPHASFTLESHPRDEWNRSYILYKVVHRLRFHDPEGLNELVYDNMFWAFPDDVPFRPKRKTPKPRIHSHQTALVVGPAGEEIYTDEFGRIKIQFYWDNYGQNDDASSLWVRVAQTWSGPGWGAVVVPRIGMEVVVSFIDGDPDRPLVVGCVYNGGNTPPYDVDSPTKSVWKTQSSPSAQGFNELSFEDAAGEEEIFIHAQKDMKIVIEDARDELIIEGNDTLDMMSGSKYLSLHGTGTDHNVTLADGCHKYQIMKGDYSIILGDESKMEDPETESSLTSAASTASSEAATARTEADSKLSAKNQAAQEYETASKAAKLAAERAANGTGTAEEAMAAAAAADAKKSALDEADQEYQEAEAAFNEKNEALTSAKAGVDKFDAKKILGAAQSASQEADRAQKKADAAVLRAQAAVQASREAYAAKVAAAEAYRVRADSSSTSAAMAAALSKSNAATRAATAAESAAKDASEAATKVKDENQKGQTAAQDAINRQGGITEASTIKGLFDATSTNVSPFETQSASAYSTVQTAVSGLNAGLSSSTESLFAGFSTVASGSAIEAAKVKQSADATLEAVLAMYSRVVGSEDQEEEETSEDSGDGTETETSEATEEEEGGDQEGAQESSSESGSEEVQDGEAEASSDEESSTGVSSSSSSTNSGGAGSSSEGGGSEGGGAAAASSDDAASAASSSTAASEGTGGNYTLFLEEGDGTIKLLKGDLNTILTEGDMTITLTKGDYTITLSKGDISIDVTGDIGIKASGDISIEAGGDIDISADGDISMSASSIDMTAKLSIDGMAGLAVSWMAGLAIDGMAALAIEHMALLMGNLESAVLVEVGGKASTKVSGAAVAIAIP